MNVKTLESLVFGCRKVAERRERGDSDYSYTLWSLSAREAAGAVALAATVGRKAEVVEICVHVDADLSYDVVIR